MKISPSRLFSFVLAALLLGACGVTDTDSTPSTASVTSSPAAASAAPKVDTQVPGGGLQAHEQAGGHTLSTHVGRTDRQLWQRLRIEPDISAASTWETREQAETTISQVLAAREKTIRRWLARHPDRDEELALTWRSPTPVGRYLDRDAARVSADRAHSIPVSAVKVVLVPATRLPTGYLILTAYPTR